MPRNSADQFCYEERTVQTVALGIPGAIIMSCWCLFCGLKSIDIALKLLHKHADMVPVTDSVMYLDRQRQQPSAIPLKELAHGENRQQEFTVIKHIDIESRKFYPGYHRDVEGVGRGSLLGSVAGGGAVAGYIVLIVF